METLKVVKSLKLSFDTLGYAVIDNKVVASREVYRSLLRSGKVEKKIRWSDDRTLQLERFYNTFFGRNKNITSVPSYKEVIRFLLVGGLKRGYIKHTVNTAKNLVKLGYLEVFTLPDGILLKDKLNQKDFYFSNKDRTIYRLINGKALPYKMNY